MKTVKAPARRAVGTATTETTLRGTKAPVIPRRAVKTEWRYTLQTQAPAGNWNDTMSTNDWNSVAGQADYTIDELGQTARIVDNSEFLDRDPHTPYARLMSTREQMMADARQALDNEDFLGAMQYLLALAQWDEASRKVEAQVV